MFQTKMTRAAHPKCMLHGGIPFCCKKMIFEKRSTSFGLLCFFFGLCQADFIQKVLRQILHRIHRRRILRQNRRRRNRRRCSDWYRRRSCWNFHVRHCPDCYGRCCWSFQIVTAAAAVPNRMMEENHDAGKVDFYYFMLFASSGN